MWILEIRVWGLLKPKRLNEKSSPMSTKLFQENLGVGATWVQSERREVENVLMVSCRSRRKKERREREVNIFQRSCPVKVKEE